MANELPANIREEVVDGIVKVVRYIGNRRSTEGHNPSFSEVWDQIDDTKSSMGQICIGEFVKDTALFLSDKRIKEVLDGNYGWVWSAVNRFFGSTTPPPISTPTN